MSLSTNHTRAFSVTRHAETGFKYGYEYYTSMRSKLDTFLGVRNRGRNCDGTVV